MLVVWKVYSPAVDNVIVPRQRMTKWSFWLNPGISHYGGTEFQESLAFKYLGQPKERQGVHKEVSARIAGPAEVWRTLKGKNFRCKRIDLSIRVRLYEVLATSRLFSMAETIPLSKTERRRMEVIRTSHLRQMQFVSYFRRIPNWPCGSGSDGIPWNPTSLWLA